MSNVQSKLAKIEQKTMELSVRRKKEISELISSIDGVLTLDDITIASGFLFMVAKPAEASKIVSEFGKQAKKYKVKKEKK